MSILKKYKWLIGGAALLCVGLAGWLLVRPTPTKDGMFYEVKCLDQHDNAYYSLIVDDEKSARAFKKEMNKTEDVQDISCEMLTYSAAGTDETLFVYAMVTVLKNVTFAFKEDPIGAPYYQVQYFDGMDTVQALSCQYETIRFDCVDELPADSLCPMTESDARAQMTEKCNTTGK